MHICAPHTLLSTFIFYAFTIIMHIVDTGSYYSCGPTGTARSPGTYTTCTYDYYDLIMLI